MTAQPPPMTDTKGVLHATVSYPFARTVGCSCGWVRTDVTEAFHEALIEAHLWKKGVK